jgi:hypothetical protein
LLEQAKFEIDKEKKVAEIELIKERTKLLKGAAKTHSKNQQEDTLWYYDKSHMDGSRFMKPII